MIHAVLLAIAVLGTAYFVMRLRRIDAFTVAWFSALLYFLPGLVGYTLSPVTPESPIKLPVELHPEASAIMAAVLAAILVGVAIHDALWRNEAPWTTRVAAPERAPDIALLLGVVGVFLTYVETGGAAFAADKRVVIEVVGRGHLLWQLGASLAAVSAYANRRPVVAAAAWGLLLLDMYIGFRYAFALSFVAVALLWAARLGPVRLTSIPPRRIAAILLAGLAIISYQNLKEPLRQGNWTEIARRTSDPLWYGQGILTSEPFTTQTVLNEIVRRDFRTDAAHVWSAFQHFLVFSPELGAESVRFNDLYQPALFPRVDHGLGNNIWGQMWSAGGWPLLGAFVLLFVGTLSVLSRALSLADPTLSTFVALNTAFVAFYVHRNELLVQVGFHKQILVVWSACVIGSWLLAAAVARLVDEPSAQRRASP